MRHTTLQTFAALTLFTASVPFAQTPSAQLPSPQTSSKAKAQTPAKTARKEADAPQQADASVPYPTEVALVNEPPKGFTYRQSPDRLPLYTWDKDAPGKSNCYDGCDTEWIPLLAPAEAKTLGEWSLVPRRDGKHQWAYRKHPVYMLVHDSADAPIGDGTNGEWHLLPHFQ